MLQNEPAPCTSTPRTHFTRAFRVRPVSPSCFIRATDRYEKVVRRKHWGFGKIIGLHEQGGCHSCRCRGRLQGNLDTIDGTTYLDPRQWLLVRFGSVSYQAAGRCSDFEWTKNPPGIEFPLTAWSSWQSSLRFSSSAEGQWLRIDIMPAHGSSPSALASQPSQPLRRGRRLSRSSLTERRINRPPLRPHSAAIRRATPIEFAQRRRPRRRMIFHFIP